MIFKNICLCYYLIEATNAAEHYVRTKITLDSYKDNISLSDMKTSIRDSPMSLGTEVLGI